MSRIQPSVLLLICCGVLLASAAACAVTSTDILRPSGGPEVEASEERPGIDRIEEAIREGAARRGWTVVKEEPGAIFAKVSSGGHAAIVRVDYDVDGWEIQHVQSSAGLRYDPDYGGREIIHFRYNNWVQRLNRSIQQALDDSSGAASAAD